MTKVEIIQLIAVFFLTFVVAPGLVSASNNLAVLLGFAIVAGCIWWVVTFIKTKMEL